MDKQTNPFEPYELQFDPSERKQMVAQMLELQRKRKDYTQREVADLLQISPQTYNGYEKGRNEIPLETLVRLSFLYDVSMDIMVQRNTLAKTQEDAKAQLLKQEEQLRKMQEALQNSEQSDNPDLAAFLEGLKAVNNALLNIADKEENT